MMMRRARRRKREEGRLPFDVKSEDPRQGKKTSSQLSLFARTLLTSPLESFGLSEMSGRT